MIYTLGDPWARVRATITKKGRVASSLTTFRDYDIVMYYGRSCFRPNIVEFNSRDQTQTIPDPDLHPRRPVGQGSGLNYEMG